MVLKLVLMFMITLVMDSFCIFFFKLLICIGFSLSGTKFSSSGVQCQLLCSQFLCSRLDIKPISPPQPLRQRHKSLLKQRASSGAESLSAEIHVVRYRQLIVFPTPAPADTVFCPCRDMHLHSLGVLTSYFHKIAAVQVNYCHSSKAIPFSTLF